MRALAILLLRGEGAFLPEWLAHHRARGFSDFLICSNGGADCTDRMPEHRTKVGLSSLPGWRPRRGDL